ncbi:MAG: hypothetical protein IJQ25_06420 [Oscillibacter sp.]|nr:hypothetical protein [Oscillibacter sp.]
MSKREENPWRSVDANGHDGNSGEDFDPTPRQQDATPTQVTQAITPATTQGVQQATTPTQVPQAATPAARPAQVQQAATQVPQSQTADELRQAIEQARQRQIPHADTSAIRGYLEQARDAATQETAGTIDRAVTQGVNELYRVQEDAEEQYRTQRNQIDLDERRAYDNRAAYDAARGVRGGIAGEQYSSIANTAAQNRATLNTARTKLGTDLRRQMAELRANGEWEKAKSLLQATQAYLQQLAQLEQWAQEYNVGVDQFNAQLEQSYMGLLLQLRQMEISTDQWEREFAANRADTAWNQQFQQQQADTARQQWQLGFQADRADTAWNQQFQQQQADTARQQWQLGFQADRADTAWNQQFQQQQADTARQQWQLGFQADRADTAWNQLFQQGQAAFQQRQYADTRADTARQEALSRAESMMNVGMMPDDDTLQAAGISKEYAQLYISAVQAAQELSTAQAAAELEAKQADALKKTAEAQRTIPGASGNLAALAEAYVASGSETPKTWLAENYKSFGFASKPDFDEFQDAVDTAQERWESRVERDAGPGVNDRSYSFFEQRIQNALDDGTGDPQKRLDDVTAQIDRIWGRLSVPQRQALLRFLSRYGMSYEPD